MFWTYFNPRMTDEDDMTVEIILLKKSVSRKTLRIM